VRPKRNGGENSSSRCFPPIPSATHAAAAAADVRPLSGARRCEEDRRAQCADGAIVGSAIVRVVEDGDLSLVRQVLRAQEYWRLKGLSADVVILNEHPAGYLAEMHEQLQGLLEVVPRLLEAAVGSRAFATWDEAELLESPMISTRGAADAERLGESFDVGRVVVRVFVVPEDRPDWRGHPLSDRSDHGAERVDVVLLRRVAGQEEQVDRSEAVQVGHEALQVFVAMHVADRRDSHSSIERPSLR